jgi:PAS domain S-box-containing protein
MVELIQNLLTAGDFIPHGHCYLWQPELVWLHIISDALIAIAYYSIPLTLLYFVRKRQDLPFNWIFLLLGSFIVACGTTHLMEIWTLWHPTYWLSGLLKAFTATISLYTAICLVSLLPKVLALPSLAAVNQDLEREIVDRKQVEAALKAEKQNLEIRVAERTAELLQANQHLQQELEERKQIQTSLQISQARFAGILEIASDAIISVDANQHITLFNQGAEKLFGYQAEEVIGELLDRLLPERSIIAHRQHVSGFAQSNSRARRMGERSEIFGLRKDGSEFPAEASISRLNLGSETVFTAILRDISERKRAEELLRSSEERLQLALEGADDGLWDWNVLTGECYFSSGWVRMLGYAPGELAGDISVWEQLIHPDDQEWVLNLLNAHLQDSSVPYKFDYRMATKSGDWKWIANYGKVTKRDENGSPLRMTGTHRNISDRKQAELSLSRLAAIVESSEDAIVSKTLNGVITSWNSSAERLYGYTAEEAIGQSITLIIPPSHLAEEQQSFHSIQHNEPVQSHETVRQRKDGTLLDVALTLSPLKDTTGNLVGISSIARDITDRLQIDRMKSEFISVVSHELRTPLTSIHGSLGMLASGLLKPDSDQGKRMLQIAVDSTNRLVRLINDILDIERIESGRVKMEKEFCQVDDLINEAIDVVQPLANKAEVILSVTKLPLQVWADPDRIIQTLTNLLSNAIKFSPAGSTVWLTIEERGKGEERESEKNHLPIHPCSLLFSIQDQGRGIPADKLDSIFERFQQVDSSDSRNHEGTGLGLAICRSIVQQHDGHIWVESILGEGSTFYFTLPIQTRQEPESSAMLDSSGTLP